MKYLFYIGTGKYSLSIEEEIFSPILEEIFSDVYLLNFISHFGYEFIIFSFQEKVL